ncbi:MAG: D-alanyl-D-alanine carboxypeptidase family protein [Candidatus Paracaedibacteraceae bacterium]|nr:D-alanyl-D-alanine carboxypeptidase family protein [Candidatus Paracaedibacteraceae bacterium]
MTRFTIFLILSSFLFSQTAFARSYKTSRSALVVDSSGKVLYSENADEPRHPASLTKKMTLYLLFEALKQNKIKLNTRFKVSPTAARQMPCKLGISSGKEVTVEVIIKALVTKSANDMALTAAEGLAGSLPKFVAIMNKKAQELSMHCTHFTNASGVPDRNKHMLRISNTNRRQSTTARDMVTLSMALHRDFPEYWKYFQLRSFTFQGNVHHNHNHLMKSFPGMDGIKTGWVTASGFNLSTSAVRYTQSGKAVRLFAVYLGGSTRHDRDRRIANLMEIQFKRLGATIVRQKKVSES